jgi:ABC-2 type transport system permease protein
VSTATNSATPATPATRPGAPASAGVGALLRVEARRLAARRFVRVLLALLLLGFVVAGVVVALTHSRPTPAVLAEAEAERDRIVIEANRLRQECLEEARAPSDLPAEQICGPAPSADDIPVRDFVDRPAFVLADQLPPGAVGMGITTAALLFLVGATFLGAEWSTRSLAALLVWEPRRLRVFGAKLAVLAAGAALVAAAAQLLWTAVGWIIAATRGTTTVPAGFWGDLLAQQGRAVLVVVLAGLFGAGIAHLTRGTGGALGVGFFYVLVVETAVRVLRPRWQEWLISDNALALLLRGGFDVYVPVEGDDFSAGRAIHLSNLHGGLLLAASCAALLAAGAWLFRRTDLQ